MPLAHNNNPKLQATKTSNSNELINQPNNIWTIKLTKTTWQAYKQRKW